VETGVRYVVRDQVLLGSMALDLFAVLFGGTIALLPVFAKDILKVDSIGLGILNAAPTTGALITMLWANHHPPVKHAGRNLFLAVAGFVRLLSPDHLRGRIAAVSMIFIGSSNELGAFESGVAASLLGTVRSVWAGGVVTLLIVGTAAVLAPKLRTLSLDPTQVVKRDAEVDAELDESAADRASHEGAV
jgi:hypothetical protein